MPSAAIERRRLLLLGLLWPLPARAQEGRIRILVQSSPLAGSQFHELPRIWLDLREGDLLTLVREQDNPHDPWAVRVDWRGHPLGYVPRAENQAIAATLDQGEALKARIFRLRQDPNPWKRLEFQVYLEL